MDEDWLERFGTLLEAPSPAVLTTYRQDGTALTSPVWFRLHDAALEVVIAEGDVKLRHLQHRPARAAIAGRYLGVQAGLAFARQRDTPGVRIRLDASAARVWDLSAILPAQPV